MAASGVLLFEDVHLAVDEGGIGQTFVILDESQDVLVFDPARRSGTLESASDVVDFVIFETEATVTETLLAPPTFLLVEAPPAPTRVVLEGTHEDVMVVTPGGPPGPPGTGLPGPPGPAGPAGTDGVGSYYAEFSFATPSTTWTIVHNQNSLAMTVETLDVNGDPLDGYVRLLGLNTIEVDWYYPTAGAARVFK